MLDILSYLLLFKKEELNLTTLDIDLLDILFSYILYNNLLK